MFFPRTYYIYEYANGTDKCVSASHYSSCLIGFPATDLLMSSNQSGTVEDAGLMWRSCSNLKYRH